MFENDVCPHLWPRPPPSTHCQWIARATKSKRSHVFGVQIWDAKSVGFACMIVSVYASGIGLLKGVNVACVLKCRKLPARGPRRASDERSRSSCEIFVTFDVFEPCWALTQSLRPSLIFAIVRVVTATILECQLACLYPFNKSDFLSEIRALLFKKIIRIKVY